MDRARFEHLLTHRTSRRRLVAAGLGLGSIAAMSSLSGRPTRAGFLQSTPVSSPRFSAYPFALGTASGDPLPNSVVLWTRLAPDPVNGGGLDDQGPIEVRWELAADEGMTAILQQGTVTASPDLAHSVHVDAAGLEPGTEYYYRFMAGNEVSPVARTKTAPPANAPLDQMRFAFASCQHWETGYYPAHRHMSQDDLDLVIHLGDYIYEGGVGNNPDNPRKHNGPEIMSLVDYRNRYGLYKGDLDLQASHQAFPWAVTWDDHEVDNNWTAEHDQDGTPPEIFMERRALAFQAYYEHMPLRPESMPVGPDMQLYRRFTYGDLVEFSVLDSRQYRTDHPCGDGLQVPCAAAMDPAATLLGPEQERWLLEGLSASSATWNVLAQQIMAAAVDRQPGLGKTFGMDSWNGYPAARDRILGHFLTRQISNPIVITGDVHAYWVNDLLADFGDPGSPVVASEFVGTSISSNGDEDPAADPLRAILPENPFVKFMDGTRRGYVRCDVTRDRWRADLQSVTTVYEQDAPIETLASFVVEAGQPGVQPA